MTPPPELRKIPTSHGSVACRYRQGPDPVVLIHGLAGDSTHFSGVFSSAAANGRGLIGVDLLGAGESDRLDPATPHSFKLQAEAVRETLAELGITQAGLAVHSMGAGLLPWLPSSAGLELSSIFMIEGNLIAEDAYWSGSLAAMPDDEFQSNWSTVTRTARVVLARQLARSHDRAQVAEWSASFGRWDARAIRETSAELHEITVSGVIADALKQFTGRKVYLRGEDGRVWSGRPLLGSADAEYIGVPDAGHYVMLDDPEAVADALK